MIAVVLHLDDGDWSAVYGVVLVKDEAERDRLLGLVEHYQREQPDEDINVWLRGLGFNVPEEYHEMFVELEEER